MKAETVEYIRGLKPAEHVDGNDLVRKGMEIGNSFEAGRSRFIRESNGKYSCHMDFKKECMREGKINWNILLGLATLEEQVEGISKIYDFTLRTGLELHDIQCIPSGIVGLPKEYRDKALNTTSYVMEELEDYEAHIDAAPMDIFFNDHHLVTPNAIETTINALKVGSPRIGEFSQFTWGYPGFNDDLKRYSDMITAFGIMASKRDEMFSVETYLDDGFPGYFMDCASYIGYALLEHYICCELCGARYSISYGGLLSEGDTRIAIAVALHKLLSTEEQPVLTYINGSTTMQWDHDIHGNYGTSCQEMLFEILAEKHYHMGLGINPVAITEKIAVPTLQELMDIFTAGKRIEEKADEWMPFMDFSKIDEMAEVMMREGKIFFDNLMDGFQRAGINTKDPLEMILVIKNFNPIKFEQAFHSSTCNEGSVDVIPFYPTVLGRQTMEMKNDIISQLTNEGFKGSINGKNIVIASGDAHTYGIILVEGVLSAMGASVVNGGVDMDPIDVLDLADELGVTCIGISCHNGQALDYGKQLLELAEQRNRKYCIFMGGKLNAILPGHSEPTEIDGMLKDLGINAYNDLRDTVRIMRDSAL